MELFCKIHRSKPDDGRRLPSRFQRQETIKSHLEEICVAWKEYLQKFVEGSEALFGKKPELPWELDKQNERAIVSTLAAAISRKFPQSLVIEELNVMKSESSGRCDLWTSIPELPIPGLPFSFYLEAKRSRRDKSSSFKQLGQTLRGTYGIGKLFGDLGKSKGTRITHSSPYANSRKHEHFYIGLLITVFASGKEDYETIEEMLESVFEAHSSVKHKKKDKLDFRSTSRRLFRFPSVSLVVLPEDKSRTGMIASFMVLGATKRLRTKAEQSTTTG